MPKIEKPIKFLSNVTESDALSVKYADIETIKFLPDNIKAHDRESIIGSIQQFGFVEPIGINRTTGHDIFGNGRLECLLQMLSDGEKCPKGIIERPEAQKTAKSAPNGRKWYAPIVDGLAFDEKTEVTLAARLNRTSETGGIDAIKAFEVLNRLKKLGDGRFEQTGYDLTALETIQRLARFREKMIKNAEAPETHDAKGDRILDVSDTEFCAKLNEKWKVSSGDLWQIGDHRLKCGDSTSDRDFRSLVPADENIRLCFSSPPYDNQRSYETEGFNWTELMNGMFRILTTYLESPADIVINLGIQYKDAQVSFYWNDWLARCADLKWPLYGLYVWDKGFGYPGEYFGRLANSHEYLFHFSIGHAKANKWIPTTGATLRRGPSNFSKRKQDGSLRPGYTSPDKLAQDHKIPDSVVRMFNEQARGIHTKGHPAAFPVSLPEFMMQTWSHLGDIVYEPFSGSGTTIIAGQNLGRCVRAMEISPNYCALALERVSLAFPDLEIKRCA